MNRPLNLALVSAIGFAFVLGLMATVAASWTLDSPADGDVDRYATFPAMGQAPGATAGQTCACELRVYGDNTNAPDSWFGALLRSKTGTADALEAWQTPSDPDKLFDPEGLQNDRWPEKTKTSSTITTDMIMKVTRAGDLQATAWYNVTPDPDPDM